MQKFHCSTLLYSGDGSIRALGEMKIKKLLLVCDPFFADNGVAQTVIHAANSPENRIFSQIVPDPSVTLAAKGAAEVNAFLPDTVIALGGGSTMDTAKAMVYFSNIHPKFIAIPTTSGSGSEVTDFAILTHEGVKHPLVDQQLRPDIAILDSQLLNSLPASLIADGGFDLISHALEAYVSSNHSPFSDLMASKAFETASEQLQASFDGDTSVRGNIHTAATMAGIAFSQAGLGICHAIAHSLGGEFHTPHGRLNAILLPAVIDTNASACGQRYAEIARSVNLSCGSDHMALRSLKNALIRLRRNLKLPETLYQAGISPTDLQSKMDLLVDAALSDPCCSTNPVAPDKNMIRRIINEVAGHG